MAKKTGVILIKVSGKVLEAQAGVKVNFGGMERTVVKANNKVVGFFEQPIESSVQCTIPHDANTDIDEVRGWDDVTVVVNPDAGPSYQIDHAFVTKALELSDAGGGIAVEFMGPAAEKL